MKSQINYKIFTDKKLVLEYFCGNLSWKDLMENKRKLALEKNYDPTFNIIDDVRDAFIVYSEEEIEKFVDLINSTKNLNGNRKTAILTDTPNQLVNSITLDTIKRTPFKLKTVSTLQAATKWVDAVSSDYQFIKTSFEELKKEANNS